MKKGIQEDAFLAEITNDLMNEEVIPEKYDVLPLIVEKPKEKSKNLDITFYAIGGGDEIGASSYYLRINNCKFLIDSGLRINSNKYGENFPRFSDLRTSGLIDVYQEIDAVLLTHGHLDHVGSLNKLFELKGNVPIYSSPATKDIANLLLADLFSNSTNEFFDEKLDLESYKQIIVEKALTGIITKKIGESIIAPNNNFEINFYNAGHILGARMIHIKVGDYSVLVTGDFSSKAQDSVPAYMLPENLKVDCIISENTYGNKGSSEADTRYYLDEDEIFEEINKTIDMGGNILIPAFAIGRSQEMALFIERAMQEGKIKKKIPIYIDATSRFCSRIYEKHGVKIYSRIIKEAKSNHIRKYADEVSVTITSSGMMIPNSKSYRYAVKMLEDKKNLILFCGYLAPNSFGKRLLNNYHNYISKIRMDGKELELNARIFNFSRGAHTNEDGIKDLIEKVEAGHVVLVHGSNKKLREKNLFIDLHKKYNGSKSVHLAYNGLKIHL